MLRHAKNSTQKPPRVSVIIPTYNRADTLPEAVESVLAQTYRDFEIVIIDDGSTDGTGEIMRREFEANPFVKILSKDNGGASKARNYGIQRSRSEFIAFVDSDDILLPEKLERQVAVMDSHPEAGLCFTDFLIWGGPKDGSTFFTEVGFQGDATLEGLLYGPFLPGPTPMIRRSCLEQTDLFDPAFEVAHDFDLWIRLMALQPAIPMMEVLYRYRVHGEQLTSDVSREHREIRQVIEKNRELLEGLDSSMPRKVRKALGHHYHVEAYDALLEGRRRDGFRALLKAMALRPAFVKNYIYFLALAVPGTWLKGLSRRHHRGAKI